MDTAHRLRQLGRSAAQRPGVVWAAAVSTVLIACFEVVVPLLTKDAVDIAVGQSASGFPTRVFPGLPPLGAVVACLLIVALARFGFQFFRRFSAGRLSLAIQHDLRVRVLESVHGLDGPGQEKLHTGQLVSRSISDLNTVQGITSVMPLFVGNIIKVVIMLVVMVMLSVKLTIIAVVAIPLVVWGVVVSRPTLFAATWAAQQQAAQVATAVEKAVGGIRVVKAFAQEQRELDAVREASVGLYEQRMRAARLSARYQPIIERIPTMAMVFTIAGGGYLALNAQITVGTFVAFAAYMTDLTAATRMVSSVAIRIQLGLSSLERVFEVIDLSPQPAAVPEETVEVPAAGPLGVQLSGVSFAPALHDVSFEVAPGSTTAIVGPPGAGKTMLTELLGRFYRPDSGSIFFLDREGGRFDFNALSTGAIRREVVCVFDDSFLYSASVRDNITMKGSFSEEEIAQAVEDAGAAEFISRLPRGLDEVIGERGLTLSGGQRQRIALARALLARPRVLVLDDATSAIDATTEREIFRALHRRTRDVCVIAIAHRRSTLALADSVVVLDAGRVKAAGPRAELESDPAFTAVMETVATSRRQREAAPPPAPQELVTDKQLWPEDYEPPRRQVAAVGGRRGGGQAGMGHGMGHTPGGGGTRLGAQVPATAELLLRVESLPPAREHPPRELYCDPAPGEPAPEGFSVWELLGRVKGLIALVVVLLIVGGIADIVLPTLMRFAIDHGVLEADPAALHRVVGAGVAVVLVSVATAALLVILTARTGERLLLALRVRSFRHLLKLSMSYFDRTRSGAILTRMTTDIDSLSSFLQTGVAGAVLQLTTLVAITVMLVVTNPQLAAVALAVTPLLVAATLVFRRVSARLYGAARSQISTVNAEFHEHVNGLKTAQMHRVERIHLENFAAQSQEYVRLRVRAYRAISLYFPGIMTLTQVARIAVLGYGGYLVMQGRASAGVLVAFSMYLGYLFGPIQQLSAIYDSYQQAAVGFGRIAELLSTEPDIVDAGNLPVSSHATGDIEFRGVSFAYSPTGPQVLSPTSVTIAAGTTVALVGPTGAGKSTLVKLISRYYAPTEGSIVVDGVALEDFPVAQWRRHLGTVPQEAFLFPGSIAENIAYGKPDATREEIEAATRAIGGLGLIAAIEGGFHHQVGERGQGLSSGQRQLIALARAELIQPDVLLLDEATATLDPATEALILGAMERATAGRTAVVVAHRLATAARADRIVVLQDGGIVEEGTHAELLAAKGAYAALWEASSSAPSTPGSRTR